MELSFYKWSAVEVNSSATHGEVDCFRGRNLNVFCETNGPGKLCRAMAIGMSCNGLDVTLGEDMVHEGGASEDVCVANESGALQVGCSVAQRASSTGQGGRIWVEWDVAVSPENVVQTTRIGIRYAKDYPRRFHIRGSSPLFL
jgi:3-methyladenine DNA glycosylase Mpg